MMDAAYFVGRKEILEWLNGLLHLNLAKIEETASGTHATMRASRRSADAGRAGAIACQLMDIVYPGKVPMKRVKWNAKLEVRAPHPRSRMRPSLHSQRSAG